MTNLSYSVYPQDIDGYATLPLRRDGIHEIVAADHNRLRDAIVKIEAELGVQPSGTFATVASRLDNIGDAHALILAHMADPTDAHDASAISILDTADNFFEIQVEGALEELSSLLPPRPDEMGEDNSKVPNHGISSFFDGYGTKFVFNTSSADEIHKKTQPSAISGLRGIHVVDVGDGVDDGYALIRMSGALTDRYLEFWAPGDSSYGSPVSIANWDLTDSSHVDYVVPGTWVTLESENTHKRIRVAKNGVALNYAPTVEESFDIYRADFVEGYYSLPAEGFKYTQHISRTAISKTETSRLQCMIGGTVFPADRGTLVLQRKTRGVIANPGTGDDGWWPVAVLDLGDNFDEDLRGSGQPVYTPSMTLFDTITLYDRYPVMDDYTLVTADANGGPPYDDFENNYSRMQVAKYVLPISNSEIVGGTVTTPPGITDTNADDHISGFRMFHYKEGITSFIDDPTSEEVYGKYDISHPDGGSAYGNNDADNEVRYSNIYIDDSPTRPGVELLNLRPVSDSESTSKYISGVRYYNGSSDLFEIELRSDNNVFNKTYVVDDILTFETDVFNFPSGTTDGGWGAQVDIQELTDDGYIKWASGNLPAHEDQTFYIVNDYTLINGVATNDARRIYPAADRFSNHSWIQATLHDPFGPGDGYDAYGAESIHRILTNSYSTTRATDTIEYFTDESKRILDTMVFDPVIDDLTPGDGYDLLGYESTSVLPSGSLQVGGRFTSDEFNVAGLVYPQTDYYNVRDRIRPTQQNDSGMDYSSLTGHRQYQRLFSLGYPINSAQLRIVSGGNTPISFEDIRQGNLDRFAKIEVKAPGHGVNSTEWLDIGRLYATGPYEDGYGALHGAVTGSAGGFTVPFTLGVVNTADDQSYSMEYGVAVRVTYFGETETQRQESKKRIMTMIQLLP